MTPILMGSCARAGGGAPAHRTTSPSSTALVTTTSRFMTPSFIGRRRQPICSGARSEALPSARGDGTRREYMRDAEKVSTDRSCQPHPLALLILEDAAENQ